MPRTPLEHTALLAVQASCRRRGRGMQGGRGRDRPSIAWISDQTRTTLPKMKSEMPAVTHVAMPAANSGCAAWYSATLVTASRGSKLGRVGSSIAAGSSSAAAGTAASATASSATSAQPLPARSIAPPRRCAALLALAAALETRLLPTATTGHMARRGRGTGGWRRGVLCACLLLLAAPLLTAGQDEEEGEGFECPMEVCCPLVPSRRVLLSHCPKRGRGGRQAGGHERDADRALRWRCARSWCRGRTSKRSRWICRRASSSMTPPTRFRSPPSVSAGQLAAGACPACRRGVVRLLLRATAPAR